MDIKTIEDIDKAVRILSTWVSSDIALVEQLKRCHDPETRWLRLETALYNAFPIKGVGITNWQEPLGRLHYRIRERTFYELQKQGLNFGFCEYFKPKWREQAENLLLGKQASFLDDANHCTYEQEMATNCEGTDNVHCKVLPPEKRRIIIRDGFFSRAVTEATFAKLKAFSRYRASN